MGYAVLSDIHGNHEKLSRVIHLLGSLQINTLLIAGDLAPRHRHEIPELLRNTPWRIFAVRGNCDSHDDEALLGFPLPAYRKITYGKKTILMSHGHISIRPASAGLNAGDISVSGHTHIPLVEKSPEGIILLNPGSVSLPRGNSCPSFGIIREGGIELRNSFTGRCFSQYRFEA